VDGADSKFQVSLSNCEREPIHIPGAIQPFGFLLTLSEPRNEILQASANAASSIGLSRVEDLLGQNFFSLLEDESARRLQAQLAEGNGQFNNPYSISFRGTAREREVYFHRLNGRLIAEFEETSERPMLARELLQEVQCSLSLIYASNSLAELCQHAAYEVQRISGYDRVLIYRFDEEWNGRVVASATNESGLEDFSGHHFPASDIPSQARAVFLSKWLRIIPDVTYTPVPLVPGLDPLTRKPLDLRETTLRSVSPIHLQYLKNMGVGGSMTISLQENGRLWGLIACHHLKPRLLSSDLRGGCELIGKAVSSLLQNIEEREDRVYKQELKTVHAALVAQMASQDDLVRGLVAFDINLLNITGAEGAAAAIRLEGEWVLVGRTPTREQIDELATWLQSQGFEEDVFHTPQLSKVFPPAAAYAEVASGLMAISIPKADRSFILWFRPEAVQTVTWAGNPQKNVEHLPDGTLRIEPRASFESWRQIVRGVAWPWRKVEIEAAKELRAAILALDLRIQFVGERRARASAERLAQEKEDLMATVSHDLKNPITAVDLTVSLLERKHARALAPEVSSALTRIRGLTRRMHRLIHDLLDISSIEGGKFQVTVKPTEVSKILGEVVELMQPIAMKGEVSLVTAALPGGCQAFADEERVQQVLSNLIGNALKFTPAGGQVEIGVSSCEKNVNFFVRDSGNGIDPAHLPHVFDRFWQAAGTRRLGSGLGLAITKGIIDAHEGRIWIESELGKGTTVHFTLPAAKRAEPVSQ
jgi:chemotaxis family two-component system sensor kinase Cph1